jgi:hypothetical protein
MPSRRTPARCECGCSYEQFRAGLTFADARKMMTVSDPDPKMWRQKRRRSVLGFMREYKIELFYYTHGACAEQREAA